jgi:L-ribulose-5-phosphate 3-epimerase UlaE
MSAMKEASYDIAGAKFTIAEQAEEIRKLTEALKKEKQFTEIVKEELFATYKDIGEYGDFENVINKKIELEIRRLNICVLSKTDRIKALMEQVRWMETL